MEADGGALVASGADLDEVAQLVREPETTATKKFSLPVALLSLGTSYTATSTRTTSTPTDANTANDSATKTCTATTP